LDSSTALGLNAKSFREAFVDEIIERAIAAFADVAADMP
jgi:hypothetical protein